MSIIILKHKVENYKKWRPFYDEDKARRAKAGLSEIICGQQRDEPNMVYMIFESSDLEKAREMLKDEELKDLMEDAGVISRPELIVIEP